MYFVVYTIVSVELVREKSTFKTDQPFEKLKKEKKTGPIGPFEGSIE